MLRDIFEGTDRGLPSVIIPCDRPLFIQPPMTMYLNSFNYSPNGIAISSADGNLIDVNESLCSLLGYNKEELLQLSFIDISLPEEMEYEFYERQQMISNATYKCMMRKQFILKNGSLIQIFMILYCVPVERGAEIFVSYFQNSGISNPIASKYLAQNRKLKETVQMMKMRIQALEEQVKVMTHNLRGPIGNILAITQIIKEDKRPGTAFNMMLANSGKKLNDMINDFFDNIHSSEPVEVEWSNVNDLVEQVTSSLSAFIVIKKVEIKKCIDVQLLPYPKVYVHNILYNLISNAIKYNEAPKATVLITVMNVDSCFKLSVTDNGLGIDLIKHGNEIFKKNQRFHQGYDSRGVGLSLIKSQVEARGGQIVVESEPLKGSTFTVSLPEVVHTQPHWLAQGDIL